MPKARNFKQLRQRMSLEAQEKSKAETARMLRDMALDELRAARSLTQQELAATLNVKQASISKLEHRTDMYVGTLSRFVKAMGGELEIRAIFPDGVVRITQFSELEKRRA